MPPCEIAEDAEIKIPIEKSLFRSWSILALGLLGTLKISFMIDRPKKVLNFVIMFFEPKSD